MKTQTYTLPSFWASALINADESGMEDSDIQAMNDWLESEKPGYCVGCSDSEFFTRWHDASQFILACDCLEFTFQVAE